MNVLRFLVVCIKQVILLTFCFSAGNGTAEEYTAVRPMPNGVSLKSIWTHNIPSLSENEIAKHSEDLTELSSLAHILDKNFESLDKFGNWEWEDLREIETAINGLKESTENIKRIAHSEKQSMDYLLQRMVQRIKKSVGNIIDIIDSIVEKRDTLRQSYQVVKYVQAQHNIDVIYRQWLDRLESNLIYLCNGYAYGNDQQKKEITSHLAKVVEFLERLKNKNGTRDLQNIINSQEVIVYAVLDAIKSGELLNDITNSDLNKVNNITIKVGNNTSKLHDNFESNFKRNGQVDFLQDIILDSTEILNEIQGMQNASMEEWKKIEARIKLDQALSIINAIGVGNLSQDALIGINRLKSIVKDTDQDDTDKTSAWANDLKNYIQHLQAQILEKNFITLSKKYSVINSEIDLMIKRMLNPDLDEDLENELILLLNDLMAIQEGVIGAIEGLPDSEKNVYEDPQRTELLNGRMDVIEQDVEDMIQLVNLNKSSNIAERIKNKALDILIRLEDIALSYLPVNILSKIYHVNDYLINVITSARNFDKITKDNEALQSKLARINALISEIIEEFENIQQEFDKGGLESNQLRTKASNLFIRLGPLRQSDYIPQYLFNEIVKLEDNILAFILRLNKANETQIHNEDASFKTYINNLQESFQEIKKNLSENTNDLYSLQKALYKLESIESQLTLLKELFSHNRNNNEEDDKKNNENEVQPQSLEVKIEKFYEDIDKLRREIVNESEKAEKSHYSCKLSDIDGKPNKLATGLVNYFEKRFKIIEMKVINDSLDWESIKRINLEIESLAGRLNLSDKFLPDELQIRIDKLVWDIDDYRAYIKHKLEIDSNESTDDEGSVTQVLKSFDIRLVEYQQEIKMQKDNWLHLGQVLFELDTIIERINILMEKVQLSSEMQDRVQSFTNITLKFKTEISNLIKVIEKTESQYIDNLTKKREELVILKIELFDYIFKKLKENLRDQDDNWFSTVKLEYRAEKLVYELKILQVTRPHSRVLEDRIKRLLEDVENFKTALEQIIKEQLDSNSLENISNCKYIAQTYKYIIQNDMQKTLSTLREFIKGASQRTQIQLAILDDSLSNITQTSYSLVESLNTEHKHLFPKSTNYSKSTNKTNYDEIIQSLKKNVEEFEEEYYRIRGSLSSFDDNAMLTEVIDKLKEVNSKLEDLSTIDVPEQVKIQVIMLQIRVRTILQSEEIRMKDKL